MNVNDVFFQSVAQAYSERHDYNASVNSKSIHPPHPPWEEGYAGKAPPQGPNPYPFIYHF